jgi:5-hydroxyisourate hydrolase
MSDSRQAGGFKRGQAPKAEAKRVYYDESSNELRWTGMSIHVVDVSRGRAAVGVRVEVEAPDGRRLFDGPVSASGLIDEPVLTQRLSRGLYKLKFHIGDYLRDVVGCKEPATVDVIHYSFGIDDAERHYHIPMKFSPYGFSCFLGGYGKAPLADLD